MAKIRTCLFGLGHMGRNHLRVLQDDPRYELLAVIDPVTGSLPESAQPVPLCKELPNDLTFDLAVVAAPTELHFALVSMLLHRGVDVFVEKPAAGTEAEASQLVALAEAKGRKLAVGNIERCNPVVRALRQVITSGIIGKPVHVNGLRAGGFPRNVKTGNNVILDLGVHELDVFRMLLGPLKVTHGVGHATRNAGIFDTAEVVIHSESGVTGSIHMNWLTPQRMRSIRVTGTEGVCLVDYIAQTCEVYGLGLEARAAGTEFSKVQWTHDTQNIVHGRVTVVPKESLKEQLDQLYAYLGGASHILATGAELIESVALVEQAQAQVVQTHVLPFPTHR